MTLKAWQRIHGKRLRDISREADMPPSTVHKALKGGRLSQQNMEKLVRYTRGEVSYDDLIKAANRAEASP